MLHAAQAKPDTNKLYWHWLSLTALGIILFCINLGNTHLWDQDEGYYAAAAAEMHAKNDWVTPTFNGELFGHKPPMMYWGMMVGYRLFGVNELGARFVSSLFGIGTILLTYQLGRKLFGASSGLFAGLAIGSCILFTAVSRSATADGHLTFFVLLSLSVWFQGYLRTPGATRDYKLRAMPWRDWAITYAAMGLAVLTKGPIGFFFPMATIGLFLLIEQPAFAGDSKSIVQRGLRVVWPYTPIPFLMTVWRMRPLTTIAVVLAVAGPWYGLVQWRTQGAFLQEFIGVHHLGRFAGAMDNHSGPIYYYLVACLFGMYPWSAFSIPTIHHWFKTKTSTQESKAVVLVTCWVAIYMVVFSLARTKLPNYVLPIYPALALVVGRYVAAWVGNVHGVHVGWLKLGWLLFAIMGLAIALGIPATGLVSYQGQTLLGRIGIEPRIAQRLIGLWVVGLPLILFGFMGWTFIHRGRGRAAGFAFAAGAASMIVLLAQYVAPEIDRMQGAQHMAQKWNETEAGAKPSVAVLGPFRPSLVFYFGQVIEFCDSPESVVQFASDHGDAIILTTDKHLERMEHELRPETQVFDRTASLPGQKPVVVLGNMVEGREIHRVNLAERYGIGVPPPPTLEE
jgi:4-amino-4-deoxy-L-arabinose transferase-like glycosyltransferase